MADPATTAALSFGNAEGHEDRPCGSAKRWVVSPHLVNLGLGPRPLFLLLKVLACRTAFIARRVETAEGTVYSVRVAVHGRRFVLIDTL